MAEGDESPQTQPPPTQPSDADKPSSPVAAFSIWPPSQRTRDAVVGRLVSTLSAPSVLSKRYGVVPEDEASAAARVIEQEAFSAISETVPGGAVSADDGGIEILQAYSKEISRRMLEVVKSRAPSSAAETPLPAASDASEAFSTVDTESSS